MSQESSRISDYIIEKINLPAYITQYVALTKKGSNFSGLCPFHAEKTPSFTVNEQKHFFYCFGCQASGNIFQFAMQYHHFSFKEALEHLASYAGISLTPSTYKKISRAQQFASNLKKFLSDVTLSYQNELSIPNNRGLIYLNERNISPESIKKFKLGFSPSSSSFLSSKLDLSSYEEKVLSVSQLFFTLGTEGYKDKFRAKAVFPIQNSDGEVIAFGFRTLEKAGEPKYINSSESPIFKKREVLYGLHQAKEHIKSQKKIYVTEGYFDVIALHEKGVPYTVATLGTSITDSHIENLYKLAPNIIFLFDGDTAGKKAAHKALLLCLKKDIESKVVLCLKDKDPYDMALLYKEELSHWLDAHTQSWEEFFLLEIEETSSALEQKKLSQKLIRELSSISPFLGHSFEERVKERFFHKNRNTLYSPYSPSPKDHILLPEISKEEKNRYTELYLLCIALFLEEPKAKLVENMSLSREFFSSPEAKILFDAILVSANPFSRKEFLESLPMEIKEKVKEEYDKLSHMESYEKALLDCYNHLIIASLLEREKDLKQKIGQTSKNLEIITHMKELEIVTKKRKEIQEKIKATIYNLNLNILLGSLGLLFS